jgi:hypothetical protein
MAQGVQVVVVVVVTGEALVVGICETLAAAGM